MTTTSTVSPTAPSAPSKEPLPTPQAPAENTLATQVSALEADTGAQISVALSDGTVAGSLTDTTAWSTSKVPLAIAAYRQDPSTTALIDAAITVSDNASAQALWDGLGGGEQAAAAVGAVLAEAGDTSTQVQPYATREGFTAFGQTMWSTQAQASFAAALPGLAGSEAVLGPMGRIDPAQSYGLGLLPNAAFKGGWGPDASGQYLIRQFGLIDGRGIAIAVIPADGTYESGQRVLDRIALEILQDQ